MSQHALRTDLPARASRLLCLIAAGAGLCLAHCASSQAEAATPARAKVPAVPQDALDLMVGEPSTVLDVQVQALARSPAFTRLRPLLERKACIPSGRLDFWLGAGSRALVAGRVRGQQRQLLVIASGTFSDDSAERALSEWLETAPPSTSEAVGRFTLYKRGSFAASVLERRFLLVGDAGWLRDALASVEHPAPSFAGSPLWRTLASDLRCSERTVCFLAASGGVLGPTLQRASSTLGAPALGRQLAASDSGLALSLGNGAQLELRAQLPSADAASAALPRIKDWLWQAGLVTRLAGLPDVLGEARVQTRAERLQIDLDVNPADLAAYEARLEQLLEHTGQDCPPQNGLSSG